MAIGFEHASEKALIVAHRMKNPNIGNNPAVAQAELRSLEDSILLDMRKHKFVQIVAEHTKYLNCKTAFSKQVADSFPSARVDAYEAGNCICVGLGSAAVFHLMHVVEWGFRSLANSLGMTDVVTNWKKNETTPIEFAQWERILQQLPEYVESKINSFPRGPKKQRAQEFYHGALQDIGGFKDAWRNHVMHTRRHYSTTDAIAVYSHVERFMKSLADHGIEEVK